MTIELIFSSIFEYQVITGTYSFFGIGSPHEVRCQKLEPPARIDSTDCIEYTNFLHDPLKDTAPGVNWGADCSGSTSNLYAMTGMSSVYNATYGYTIRSFTCCKLVVK